MDENNSQNAALTVVPIVMDAGVIPAIAGEFLF